MDTSTGPSIGQRIAHLRGHRMTQAGLAASAGVSVDLIRKLEQGRRHTVTIGSLQRIARALDVDAGELLSKTQALPDPGEHSGAVAIRRALTHVDDLVGDQPDLEPLTLDEARRTVTLGWGYYWAGRYDQLGHLLPNAIGRGRATVRDVSADQRAEARDLTAQLLQLSSCVLVHLGYGDVAHLALREALTLAADGSDPLLGSVLRGSLSWVLLTQGRYDEAHRLATASAAGLAPTGESPLPAWSVYGSLLLGGATAAGRAGDRPLAGVLLDEAHLAAERTGARNDYETAFGPDQVLMQTVDVEVVTENYGAALTTGRRMPPNAALPVAARARHLSDLALAHTRLGRDAAALDVLLGIEHLAPDWMRYQSQPKADRARTPRTRR
ncbi:helix-turn-helix domain-containing protein [Pseudonocardia sp. CA-107938]|uniref:helix-turn-helix domain-containing protein n=1 Tax=Pseudonocardia sp. CA-107938 TaxID=3240021 RepID=UPI003D8DE317